MTGTSDWTFWLAAEQSSCNQTVMLRQSAILQELCFFSGGDAQDVCLDVNAVLHHV